MGNKIYDEVILEDYQIFEADSSPGVGTSSVLGILQGNAFVPDGYSRNGRFYSKTLWENAIKNQKFNDNLKGRRILGCIGHPTGDYTLDELLASGRVSHIVSDVYIDKKDNMGKAKFEILDTPAGRILNSVLRAGAKPYVSTRGFGEYDNKAEAKLKGGREYKVLDSKNFYLESIDVVLDPGFLEAQPELKESLQEDFSKILESKEQYECAFKDGTCDRIGEWLFEVNKDKVDTQEDNIPLTFTYENFTKEELFQMVGNLIEENKTLLNFNNQDSFEKKESEKDDKDDELEYGYSISKKDLLISHLEVLTRLLKYNISYKKEFDIIVEYLDKFEEEEIEEKEIIDKINELCTLFDKHKEIDESILKVIENIRKTLKRFDPEYDLPDSVGKNKDDKKEISKYSKGSEENVNSSNKENLLKIYSDLVESYENRINKMKNFISEVILSTHSNFEKELSKNSKIQERKSTKLLNQITEMQVQLNEVNKNTQHKDKEYNTIIQELKENNKTLLKQLDIKNKDLEIQNDLSTKLKEELEMKEKYIKEFSEQIEIQKEEFQRKLEKVQVEYSKKDEKLENLNSTLSHYQQLSESSATKLKERNENIKILEDDIKNSERVIRELIKEKYILKYPRLEKKEVSKVIEDCDYTPEKIDKELSRKVSLLKNSSFMENNDNTIIGTELSTKKTSKKETRLYERLIKN